MNETGKSSRSMTAMGVIAGKARLTTSSTSSTIGVDRETLPEDLDFDLGLSVLFVPGTQSTLILA